jgi:hypothetical protein|eukprot:COSAG01_NODE_11236_length_1976_cov_1.800746_2_plen_67_part_00
MHVARADYLTLKAKNMSVRVVGPDREIQPSSMMTGSLPNEGRRHNLEAIQEGDETETPISRSRLGV